MSDSVRLKLIKKSCDLVDSFSNDPDELVKSKFTNELGFRLFVCRCLVAIICLLLIQAGEKMTDARLRD